MIAFGSFNTIFISLSMAVLLSYAVGFAPSKVVGYSWGRSCRLVSSIMTTNSNNNDSVECMPVLPDGVVKYSQVPREGKTFSATTIPKGLLKEHSTKKGTWGVINVSQGKLEYKITGGRKPEEIPISFELSPEFHGIIQPQLLHQVKALTKDVEFVVEFLRLPGTGPVDEKREGI